MEPESSSPYPQMLATRPYPEPTLSSPHPNLPYATLILGAHKLISGFQKVKYRKLDVLT